MQSLASIRKRSRSSAPQWKCIDNCIAGFYEAIYCEALAIEFGLRRFPFESESPLQMEYKGHRLTGIYRMDFVCFGQ